MTSLNPEYLFYNLYHWFVDPAWGDWWLEARSGLRLVSFVLTMVFLVLVIRLVRRIIALRREERDELERLAVAAQAMAAEPVNAAWERVLGHFNSPNPNDWKQAIIEADTMLDDLVKKIRPAGESLGERLKTIEISDFSTLDQAWSAHKLRNRIAHESGYELAEREAREALANYRAVFEEFKII